jgi:hypothetical protein
MTPVSQQRKKCVHLQSRYYPVREMEKHEYGVTCNAVTFTFTSIDVRRRRVLRWKSTDISEQHVALLAACFMLVSCLAHISTSAFTGILGVISQITEIFIGTAVRTSNPTSSKSSCSPVQTWGRSDRHGLHICVLFVHNVRYSKHSSTAQLLD